MTLSGRRTRRYCLFLFAGVFVLAAPGCAKKRHELTAVRDAYAKGKYEEAWAMCERFVREGSKEPEVYYYSGMSLLAMGKDAEARERLGTALKSDSTLAGRVAEGLVEQAEAARSRGSLARSARLARTAVEFDNAAPVGALKYLVALSYFEDKNWPEAGRYYAEAIAEFPDSVEAESGHFNLAACRAAMGDSAGAVDAIEEELSRFPDGEFSGRARWTLSNLLFERGRSQFDHGDYDGAVWTAKRVIDETDDTAIVQKARFLLGESYERMEEFERAYEQYKMVAGEEGGAPGGIAERARAKMRAFHDAGLP